MAAQEEARPPAGGCEDEPAALEDRRGRRALPLGSDTSPPAKNGKKSQEQWGLRLGFFNGREGEGAVANLGGDDLRLADEELGEGRQREEGRVVGGGVAPVGRPLDEGEDDGVLLPD